MKNIIRDLENKGKFKLAAKVQKLTKGQEEEKEDEVGDMRTAIAKFIRRLVKWGQIEPKTAQKLISLNMSDPHSIEELVLHAVSLGFGRSKFGNIKSLLIKGGPKESNREG